MELDEFISTSIVQIAKGIRAAQFDASHVGAVAPGAIDGIAQKYLMSIEFDVAVTVEKHRGDSTDSDVNGRGGIRVLGLEATLGGKKKTTQEDGRKDARVSRVKFSVPIDLIGWYKKDEDLMPDLKQRKEVGERRAKVRKDYV